MIERLEDHCEIIQSNTDGILVKLRRYEDFEMLDDLCWEWEQRTGMRLEFDEFQKVYQKDVNNYIIIPSGPLRDEKGKPRWKCKVPMSKSCLIWIMTFPLSTGPL